MLVLIFKPFLGLWKFILKPITLRAYQSYLKLKSKIDKSPILKSKIGFVLYNRNVIYVILVIITLFVASTNLILAKDTKREDVAKKSNLYKLVQPTLGVGDEEIVEKANMNKQQTNYVDTSSNLVAVIPEIAEKDETNSQVMLLGEGTTLASSTVLEKDYSLKRSGIIEYTIEDGDTISMIAERFSVSVSTLYWANNLNSSSYIQPGKTLKIPPGSGVIHKVVSGDTLDSIINKYSGNKELTIKYNDIGSDEMIAVGTELLVADGTPPPPPTPVVKTPSTTISNSWGSFFQPTNNSNVTTGTLNWPSACHSISQNPRWGHIAIDVNCASGTPIYAAESGTATVIPNRGNGYGNYIIINHGNGMQTLYGHMTGFAVSNGQYVTRGQQIGYEGSTGWSTGPHLHFEVKINGANQNPWNYL
ncbi:MAG: peptidoglycan DD-metalloendopeptidase family protein [Patescibacteria group bacterium]